MVRRSGDMRSHHLLRHDQACAALNVYALHRIGAVGRPDSICALQHSHIDAPAARCAAFNFQLRVVLLQRVDQLIYRFSLHMHGRSFGIQRYRLCNRPVVIPFDVVDTTVVDDGAQRIENVVTRIKAAHI